MGIQIDLSYIILKAYGCIAESLKAMVKAAKSKGLRLIPGKESLSHVGRFINMDTDISEFGSEESFRKWLDANKIVDYDPNEHPLGQWAFVGDDLNPNLPIDDLCTEYLRIVKAIYGELCEPAPRYYNIAHDEIGKNWLCAVKADRSQGLQGSRSQLVAHEINRRIEQVHSILGPTRQVAPYGDILGCLRERLESPRCWPIVNQAERLSRRAEFAADQRFRFPTCKGCFALFYPRRVWLDIWRLKLRLF